MQDRNTLMAIVFIATLGVMLTISGAIFLIYCFVYEVRNKKKVYKESKRLAIFFIILGLLMTTLSLLYLNKTGI